MKYSGREECITLTLLHDNVTRQPNQHRQTFTCSTIFLLNKLINNKILKCKNIQTIFTNSDTLSMLEGLVKLIS